MTGPMPNRRAMRLAVRLATPPPTPKTAIATPSSPAARCSSRTANSTTTAPFMLAPRLPVAAWPRNARIVGSRSTYDRPARTSRQNGRGKSAGGGRR